MMKPPGKPCLVSVSVIGLRNLDLPEGAAFQEGDPVLLGLEKTMNFAKVGFLKIWVKAVSKMFLVLSSFSMIFWMKQFQICLLMGGFKDFLLALFAHDLCFVVLSLKLGF